MNNVLIMSNTKKVIMNNFQLHIKNLLMVISFFEVL